MLCYTNIMHQSQNLGIRPFILKDIVDVVKQLKKKVEDQEKRIKALEEKLA